MPHHKVPHTRFLEIVEILRRYGRRHPDAHYTHPLPDDVHQALLREGFSEEDMKHLAHLAPKAKIHGRFGVSAQLLQALTKVFFREKKH